MECALDSEKLAYSPEELSKLISVSEETLYKDRVHGHLGIPFVKMGSRVVYPKSKVEEWLVNSSVTPAQYQAQKIMTNFGEVKRSRGRPAGTTKSEMDKRRAARRVLND
jgi:predicted DNA-binding transcriptional regulator AlpA